MSEQASQKPMHSDIEFTNLGKINKANIKIRPFTVIAGCNSSGKSFITKSLYSLFSGVASSSLTTEMMGLKNELFKFMRACTSAYIAQRPNDEEAVSELVDDLEILRTMEAEELLTINSTFVIESIRSHISDFSLFLNNLDEKPLVKGLAALGNKGERSPNDLVKSYAKGIWIPEIYGLLDEMYELILNPEFEYQRITSNVIMESLSDNFTISSTTELVKLQSEQATLDIEKAGVVTITDRVLINADVISKIRLLNEHPPIYLESPIYWKLVDALNESKKALSNTARRRKLENNQLVNQVPKYFFDVMELLDDQVKTTVFSDIVQTIEEAISGSLSINDGGIQYTDKESSASVSLSLTASGITNLGMIALLLKRGAILPGTFLFIDEPEVHLHPAWQVVLVDVLHQLSKRGVNIVIASHSIDIMKAVENIMENDDEIDPQTHFGINQLTNDGYSVDVTYNNSKRIAAIKQDLGKPFYDMFLGA